MTKWPLWAKVLYGVLLAYSALLFVTATIALIESRHDGDSLKAPDFALQAMLMLFMPLLLIAFRSPRAASGLLLLLAFSEAILIFATSPFSSGEGPAYTAIASLIFLGLPVLGATFFLRRMASLKH